MLRSLFIVFPLTLTLCFGTNPGSVKEQGNFPDYAAAKARNISAVGEKHPSSTKLTRYIDHLPIKNKNALQKQPLSAAQGVRVYRGCVRKLNVFKSLFYKVDYGLYQGEKWIACLKMDNVLVQEHLKSFLGTTVTVKGTPEYINKDPFLVISVKEIYGEGR